MTLKFMLVLQYLGQKAFDIGKRTQCCLRKNAPIFILRWFVTQKYNFLRYIFSNLKLIKLSSIIQSTDLSVMAAIAFVIVELYIIPKLESVGIQALILQLEKVKCPKKGAICDHFFTGVIIQVFMILVTFSKTIMNLDFSIDCHF